MMNWYQFIQQWNCKEAIIVHLRSGANFTGVVSAAPEPLVEICLMDHNGDYGDFSALVDTREVVAVECMEWAYQPDAFDGPPTD